MSIGVSGTLLSSTSTEGTRMLHFIFRFKLPESEAVFTMDVYAENASIARKKFKESMFFASSGYELVETLVIEG